MTGSMKPTSRAGCFRVPISAAAVALAVCLIFWPSRSDGQYWENTVTFPRAPQKVPDKAPFPRWRGPVCVLGVVQLRDDLGRKQAVELDRLAKKLGDAVEIDIFSLDRFGEDWPVGHVTEFRESNDVASPLYFLSAEGLAGIFKGFHPGRIRVLPQVLLLGGRGEILRILRGVQAAEDLETAIADAKTATLPPLDTLSKGNETGFPVNGAFEAWTFGRRVIPASWGTASVTGETVLKAYGKGWLESSACEIRNTADASRQVLYQLVPHAPLLGRKIRLCAAGRSNSLGKLVVALAMAYPGRERGLRFAPLSPFRVSEGSDKRVPMRILAACDLQTDTASWQVLSEEAAIPADTRALAILIYLDNPEVPGGAAYVDEIRLQYVE